MAKGVSNWQEESVSPESEEKKPSGDIERVNSLSPFGSARIVALSTVFLYFSHQVTFFKESRQIFPISPRFWKPSCSSEVPSFTELR